MSVLEDILEEFFKELNDDDKVPNELIDSMKSLIENDDFSSENLLEILESSDLNGSED
ncbi:MAG: hypothetical protein Q7V10_02860 [Methanobacteriaceae archaeon]|jgi:hypothetical protein|nr:hypothetical protein [Methanobacteriaceae archaeon]MDO9626151.1 hypothetical protein [Methanobacteriaceae archaeon]